MSRHPFTLVPFAQPSPAVGLQGSLAVLAPAEALPQLALELQLNNLGTGPGLDSLRIPPLSSGPGEDGAAARGERRDGLWQHTCLECFIGPAGETHYLEFNLAPDGAWNVYALTDYRCDLRPSPAFEQLPFSCRHENGGIRLSLACSLPPAWAGLSRFDWQVSAVLEDRRGELSYWALRHPAGAADFHDRRHWTLASPLCDAGPV